MGLIFVGPIQQVGHSSIPDFLMLLFVDHLSIPCSLIRLGLAWHTEDAEDVGEDSEGLALAILDPVI